MARRVPRRPVAAPRISVPGAHEVSVRAGTTKSGGAAPLATTDSTATERSLIQLEDAVNLLGEGLSVLVHDLVVGLNRVPNPRGRTARAVLLCPTVADASFGFGYDPDGDGNPHPQREIWLTLVGVDQPRARLVVL